MGTKLYATINTDSEVLSYLKENIERKEVTIYTRRDGGLDIDVNIRSFFVNENEQKRIKDFLRKNGFTSRVGVHSRERIDNPIKGSDYVVNPLYDDKTVDHVMEHIGPFIEEAAKYGVLNIGL